MDTEEISTQALNAVLGKFGCEVTWPEKEMILGMREADCMCGCAVCGYIFWYYSVGEPQCDVFFIA